MCEGENSETDYYQLKSYGGKERTDSKQQLYQLTGIQCGLRRDYIKWKIKY